MLLVVIVAFEGYEDVDVFGSSSSMVILRLHYVWKAVQKACCSHASGENTLNIFLHLQKRASRERPLLLVDGEFELVYMR